MRCIPVVVCVTPRIRLFSHHSCPNGGPQILCVASHYTLGSPSMAPDHRKTLSERATSKAPNMCVLGGRGFVGPLLSGPTNYSSSQICTFLYDLRGVLCNHVKIGPYLHSVRIFSTTPVLRNTCLENLKYTHTNIHIPRCKLCDSKLAFQVPWCFLFSDAIVSKA